MKTKEEKKLKMQQTYILGTVAFPRSQKFPETVPLKSFKIEVKALLFFMIKTMLSNIKYKIC